MRESYPRRANELYAKAKAEIERLRAENWQLKQACGYSIPADKETVNNPFKCGTCDAKSIELEKMRADKAVLQNMLDKIAKHPDTPELLKQYAEGKLHPYQAAAIAKVSK